MLYCIVNTGIFDIPEIIWLSCELRKVFFVVAAARCLCPVFTILEHVLTYFIFLRWKYYICSLFNET